MLPYVLMLRTCEEACRGPASGQLRSAQSGSHLDALPCVFADLQGNDILDYLFKIADQANLRVIRTQIGGANPPTGQATGYSLQAINGTGTSLLFTLLVTLLVTLVSH